MKLFLAIAIIAVTLYATLEESQSCKDQGGQLVRGAVWYVCIKEQP